MTNTINIMIQIKQPINQSINQSINLFANNRVSLDVLKDGRFTNL